jgi:hypothetical protein
VSITAKDPEREVTDAAAQLVIAGERVALRVGHAIIAELGERFGLLLDLAEAYRLDGQVSLCGGLASVAEAFKADLEQRLVLCAATMRALACRVRRGRVVREILRQAEQLHRHVAEEFVALGRTGFGAAPGIADTQDAEERQDAGDEDAGDRQVAPPRR